MDIHICGCCKHQFSELDSFLAHKRLNCTENNTSIVDEVTVYTVERNETVGSTVQKISEGPQFHVCSSTLQETPENDISSENDSLQINTKLTSFPSTETTPHIRSSKHPIISLAGSSKYLPSNDSACLKTRKPKHMKCQEQGCGFAARYKKDLIRHSRKHTGVRPFCCKFCTRTFTRSDKLTLHIRSHKGEKPYKCSECSYAAVDKGSLIKHLRIHSNERPYKCQICDYASRNSSQLVVHLRTHTGDTPFHCQSCTAKFKINSDLNRHMRVHTKEKPYMCQFCSYRCSMKGNLNVHIKNNHLRDKKYVCEDCSESFCTKRQLKTHMSNHVLNKQFKCLDCDYRCKDKTSFKRHECAHIEVRSYKCDFCDFQAKYMSHKLRHIKQQHTKECISKKQQRLHNKNPKSKLKNLGYVNSQIEDKYIPSPLAASAKRKLSCAHCDASFVRKDSLNSHVKQHLRMEETLKSTALAVLQLQETPVLILSGEQSDINVPVENPELTSVKRGTQDINNFLQNVNKASKLLLDKDSATTDDNLLTMVSSHKDLDNCVVNNLQSKNTLEHMVQTQPSIHVPPVTITEVQSSSIQQPVFQIQVNTLGQVTTEKSKTSNIFPITSNVSTDQHMKLYIVNSETPTTAKTSPNPRTSSEKTFIPLATIQQRAVTSFSSGISDILLQPTVVQAPSKLENIQHFSYETLQLPAYQQKFQLLPITARKQQKVRPIASKPISTIVESVLLAKNQNITKNNTINSNMQLGEASTVMQRFVEQTCNQSKQESNKKLL